MLRYRNLSQSKSRVTLVTIFEPSSDEELGSDICAIGLSFDPSRKETLLDIFRVRNTISARYLIGPDKQFPLPELELIQQEINYLFNLILSLKPYETSQVPANSPALSH